jgi:hypothetical protein
MVSSHFTGRLRVEIDPHQIYAVIAGDIIGSSKLAKPLRESLLFTMKQGSEVLQSAYPKAIPCSVDIYAGDSWQLFVADARLALRAAVFYRAFLLDATDRKADTRLAISLGHIDFLSCERISESDGEAFRNAGKLLLEAIGKQNMHFVAPHDPQAEVWDCAVGLLDTIVQHWSAKQARAISGAIRGLSRPEIAAQWKPSIAESTVSGHLAEAGWPAVEKAMNSFEKGHRNSTYGG